MVAPNANKKKNLKKFNLIIIAQLRLIRGLELVAVMHLYTSDWLYSHLNKTLRERTATQDPSKPYRGYISLLCVSLEILPKFTITKAFRGVTLAQTVIDSWVKVEYTVGIQFDSQTGTKKVAENFATGGYLIESVGNFIGVPIKMFSKFPGEDEYLLPPSTLYKIKKGGKSAKTTYKLLTFEKVQALDPPPAGSLINDPRNHAAWDISSFDRSKDRRMKTKGDVYWQIRLITDWSEVIKAKRITATQKASTAKPPEELSLTAGESSDNGNYWSDWLVYLGYYADC